MIHEYEALLAMAKSLRSIIFARGGAAGDDANRLLQTYTQLVQKIEKISAGDPCQAKIKAVITDIIAVNNEVLHAIEDVQKDLVVQIKQCVDAKKILQEYHQNHEPQCHLDKQA